MNYMNFEDPVKKVTPSAEKERAWNTKVEEVRNRLDAAGGEMDEGIVDTVAALNIHTIPTSGSCEGHIDHGVPTPWIDIEAPDEPSERYNNEKQIEQGVAEKYGLTVEEMRDESHQREWIEACDACEASGETETYQAWREANKVIRGQVESLVQQYTDQRGDIDPRLQLQLSDKGGGGAFRLYLGGGDHEIDLGTLDDQQKRALSDRLEIYREEIKRFTKFLQNKFFEA